MCKSTLSRGGLGSPPPRFADCWVLPPNASIYSASFFSPFMDFNTFNLNIGPVHMNIAKWFETMPVRYTLRSSRVPEGSQEEEVFATISFQLVDA